MTTNCYWLGDFHPGDIIQDYLDQIPMTKDELAKQLGCPVAALDMLIAHQSVVDNYYAERLSRALGHSEEFWLNLEKVWAENEKIKLAERRLHARKKEQDDVDFS